MLRCVNTGGERGGVRVRGGVDRRGGEGGVREGVLQVGVNLLLDLLDPASGRGARGVTYLSMSGYTLSEGTYGPPPT